MTQPATTTTFAGVDDRTDAQLPAWYDRQNDADGKTSFAEAIRQLPQAIETEVAYRNRYSGDWVPTDRFNALVEPVRLFEQATGDPDADPLFHVPTSSYSIINPVDVYGPLEDVLRTEELDGVPLGEVVLGEIRQYRGGGEVHMDVLYDGLSGDARPGRAADDGGDDGVGLLRRARGLRRGLRTGRLLLEHHETANRQRVGQARRRL